MTEESGKPPIEPLKYFLRGLAIPGLIIAGCAGLGAACALPYGTTIADGLKSGVIVGAALGAFIFLNGIGEMIAAFLCSSNRFVNGACLSLGYLTIWLVVFFFILPEVL